MEKQEAMGDGSVRHALGDYRIEARNFGPIGEAEIDLRPLTVFVGPSNTGKSYLATLLYALHRSFHELVGERGGRPPFVYRQLIATNLDPDVAGDLQHWLFPDKGEESSTLPNSVRSLIRHSIEDAPGVERHLTEKSCWCFGVDSFRDLIRHGQRAGARIGIRVPRQSGSGSLDYSLRVRGEHVSLKGRLQGEPPRVDYADLMESVLLGLRDDPPGAFRVAEGRDDDWAAVYAFQSLVGTIRASLLHPFQRSIYYLPADRTGVMHSHRVVVSSLIRSAASAGLRPAGELPLLPGVMADFLDQLLSLDRRRGRARYRPRSQYQQMSALAENLERAVLRGAVRTESTAANYPEFLYRPRGWKRDLPLTQASSMVSELAPVVLYVRHLVRPGDVLIVEEPEAHLHPAMQVEVIGHLAELVEAGVRVVITTHSEWVLEELANLVHRSRMEAADEIALRPESVGVWRFHPPKEGEGSGAHVTELEMDDAGMFEAGYEQVAMDVHNRWAGLAGLTNSPA